MRDNLRISSLTAVLLRELYNKIYNYIYYANVFPSYNFNWDPNKHNYGLKAVEIAMELYISK